MAKPVPISNAILDALYNNGSSGTVVVGAVTLTLPYKCKFLSTLSTASSAGTEWSTALGYTAGGVSLAGLFTVAASGQAKANTGVIQVTDAPANTWAGCEIVDSTGTPVRLNFGPAVSLAKSVNIHDTVIIPIGSLQGTET